jgi:hypothetical protein
MNVSKAILCFICDYEIAADKSIKKIPDKKIIPCDKCGYLLYESELSGVMLCPKCGTWFNFGLTENQKMNVFLSGPCIYCNEYYGSLGSRDKVTLSKTFGKNTKTTRTVKSAFPRCSICEKEHLKTHYHSHIFTFSAVCIFAVCIYYFKLIEFDSISPIIFLAISYCIVLSCSKQVFGLYSKNSPIEHKKMHPHYKNLKRKIQFRSYSYIEEEKKRAQNREKILRKYVKRWKQ